MNYILTIHTTWLYVVAGQCVGSAAYVAAATRTADVAVLRVQLPFLVVGGLQVAAVTLGAVPQSGVGEVGVPAAGGAGADRVLDVVLQPAREIKKQMVLLH